MKKILFFLFFIKFSVIIFSQTPLSWDSPFLLPQTIFVGDAGRLVVPLGDASGLAPFVRDSFDTLQPGEDILIQRIELERRTGSFRLLIDFIPYAPGLLYFPPIDLYGEDDFIIEGLEVNVASILNPLRMSLAEPLPPLTQPGTGFLVYGSFVLLLIIIFLVLGGSILGRRHFAYILEKIRRRRLIRNMISFLRRLRYEFKNIKSEEPAFYLTLLSGEFREFLSLYTKINCRSLSAGEFLDLGFIEDLEMNLDEEFNEADQETWQIGLCNIFRNWDTLRFSGREVKYENVNSALSDAGEFVSFMDKSERQRPFFKPKEEMLENKFEAGLLSGEAL